jgi:signal transduction histidine kinase
VAEAGGTPFIVAWRMDWTPSGAPSSIHGFVARSEFLESLFARVLGTSPLLPPSLVPAGAHPNDALSVRVMTPGRRELFASAGDWSKYVAEQALQPDLADLRLAVALRPDAAGRLVIGGLPRERLPLVAGMLALTAVLVVVAVVQLRREAELARLRSDFVSGVSHELRTPLAQIRMFTETLLLGRVRSELEGRRALEIIARETRRLTQLVENVLFFARSERRQPAVVLESTPLAPIVAEVVESFAPLAAARGARVETHLDPAITAAADAGAIRQILLNLLDNAVKYGPPGQTVRIRLELVAQGPEQARSAARLTVDDEGPGIAPQDAARIWHPFSRLARADAAATGGTGIGLAIVRQLVELHGGQARVEPAPTRGARFIVEIPRARSEAPAGSPAGAVA